MNLKFYGLFCLIIGYSIQIASAEESRILINSTQNSDLYILTKTIKENHPNIRNYWDEEEYKKDIKRDGEVLYYKDESAKSFRKVNCKEDTHSILNIIVYNKDGTVKRSVKSKKDEERVVVPESLGSEIQNYICNKKIK
jgi:hypothetical protein